MIHLIEEAIAPLQNQLFNHSVYSRIKSLEQLQIFMEHHVYSVWDFMGLVKFLQNHLAPSQAPWIPPSHRALSRFINEIVLTEESDSDGQGQYCSHFELYCLAMEEIKADSNCAKNFIHQVSSTGLKTSLERSKIPLPAKMFIKSTYQSIETGKPHIVAASFAFGREEVIPHMFRRLIEKMNITQEQAPSFFYYLQRHIDLDGDEHGPLSLEIVSHLCGKNPLFWKEAKEAAIQAIQSRIRFWTEVEGALEVQKFIVA